MKNYFLIFVLFFCNALYAQSMCERVQDGITQYLDAEESRIQFKNQGGLFNGGVCWWHSRLQRASAYLVEYRPDLPRASSSEITKLLKNLKTMNRKVVIPGFSDFLTFTKAHKKEVQLLLEAWQREDGFINQEWVRGISGKYELPAAEMKTRMDKIYDFIQKSPRPTWIMAQIKGIESHAFLIQEMIPKGSGYELRVIDSNYPLETKTLEFTEGDRFLKHPKDKYTFVPYTGFQKDFELILATVKKNCGNILGLDVQDIPRGEIEVSP